MSRREMAGRVTAAGVILLLLTVHVGWAQRAIPGHTEPGTPGGCLAAGDKYLDSAYHAADSASRHTADGTHPKPWIDAAGWQGAVAALRLAAATRDKQCAAAFDISTADLQSLPDLGRLYFRAGERDLSDRAFARAFGPHGLRDTARANGILTAMTTYMWGEGYEDARNRALSTALLPRIDSIPGALEQRVHARTVVPGTPANATFALVRQMSPAQMQRSAEDITGAYTGEATRLGDHLHPDSALAVLRGAPAMFQSALASTIARYEMIGRPAPAIHADRWVNGTGSERNHGATLVVFTASWCHDCLDSYPYIEALQREFGPRGLHVVFAVALEGRFLGDSMPPAQEVSADSAYYHKHGFTCPIAIYRPAVWDASGHMVSDGTSIDARYRMFALPAFYIVDSAGTLRAEIVGWAASNRLDHELHAEIEQLLTGAGPG